jgi:hypothetical protein
MVFLYKTITTMKVLIKAIWADKKWASFWRISLYIK